jgi:hypothetical protein
MLPAAGNILGFCVCHLADHPFGIVFGRNNHNSSKNTVATIDGVTVELVPADHGEPAQATGNSLGVRSTDRPRRSAVTISRPGTLASTGMQVFKDVATVARPP